MNISECDLFLGVSYFDKRRAPLLKLYFRNGGDPNITSNPPYTCSLLDQTILGHNLYALELIAKQPGLKSYMKFEGSSRVSAAKLSIRYKHLGQIWIMLENNLYKKKELEENLVKQLTFSVARYKKAKQELEAIRINDDRNSAFLKIAELHGTLAKILHVQLVTKETEKYKKYTDDFFGTRISKHLGSMMAAYNSIDFKKTNEQHKKRAKRNLAFARKLLSDNKHALLDDIMDKIVGVVVYRMDNKKKLKASASGPKRFLLHCWNSISTKFQGSSEGKYHNLVDLGQEPKKLR